MPRKYDSEARRIYNDAIQLPADERDAFIRRECRGDASLLAAVRELIAHSELETRELSNADTPRATLTPSETPAADAETHIGKLVGHYRVVARIGRGGMGTVCRAIDTDLDRDVAIKFLPPEWALDPQRMQRFREEARTVASLNHPHIVTIYAIQDVDGVPSMVMELIDGPTLRDVLRGAGGLPLGQVLEYAVPVADALASAHASGITHRDLKPENVMITREGQVKVLDFGVARKGLSGGLTEKTDAVETDAGPGTPAYMSPEQLRGELADPRSDVFAFGILLYELTSGHRPFAGRTSRQLANAIINVDPPRLDIAPGFEAIVRRCLAKKPSARPKTMATVLDELTAFRRGMEHDSESSRAHAAYVRGRYLWERRYEDGLALALEAFNEAIALEPGMAGAHAGSADCYLTLAHYGYMNPTEAYALSRQAAQRALDISPDLAGAHATMGWIEAFFDWQWDKADESFRRAIELDPENAIIWMWYGIYLQSRRRRVPALEALRKAQQLDPLSNIVNTILSWSYYEGGDYDEAERMMGHVNRMDHRFVFGLTVRGGMLAACGRPKEGLTFLERAVALSGREKLPLSFLGFAYGCDGRTDATGKVFDELQAAAAEGFVPPLHMCFALVGTERRKEALDWLEKAVASHDTYFATMNFSVVFRNICEEPRFRALLKQMGLERTN